MVVALGPGRFYGNSLPRPRFFSGGDRVDPPVLVTDPLLAWAHEAHWSMGGLSSKRLRLQGRIEGSIDKLRRRARSDARKAAKARASGLKPRSLAALGSDDDDDSDEEEVEAQERNLKREVVDELLESEEQEENEEEEEEALATIAAAAKRKRARKLSDEFDRVATLQEGEAKKQKPAATSTPARTSPRRKAAEAAPTLAPAKASPRGNAAAEAATVAPARASPRRKAVAVAAARRTSPRMKH